MNLWREKHIIYVQYTNPGGYPPLEHSSKILAENHWQVLFLGCLSLGSSALVFAGNNNIQIRQINFMPAGWRQKLHYIWFMIWVAAWVIKWRPQWIYASDPLSCPVALFLSYFPGIQVLYHEHDSPSPAEEKQATGFMKLVFSARYKLASRASKCILPSRERSAIFKQSTGLTRKVVTVWNCPSRKEVKEFSDKKGLGPLKLYYHGSLGEARLPFTLLEAMALNKGKVQLQIVGYETLGTSGYIDKLMRLATQLGIQDSIYISKALPRYALWDIAKQNHIGLAFMPVDSSDINFQHMIGASNKAFDYLACGLALLVSELPAWCSLYVQPGYALACNPNDPESISSALQWFIAHPLAAKQMGKRGQQRIFEEWNYEYQFAPVLDFLTNPIQE